MGNAIFKIRLAVKSKGKVKVEVIDYHYLQTENEITMIYIYDKSEEATISKKDIQKIINDLL